MDKVARAERMAKYRRDNREKILEQRAKYRLENREKVLKAKTLYREKNREKIRKADALFYIKNLERRREESNAYKKKVILKPDRKAAYNAVNSAVKAGKLIRQNCHCGEKGEAHHEDYTKPLEVQWVCHKHHMELHRQY